MDSSNKIVSFTDLKVWQIGHKLVLEVYKVTRDFPKDEVFGLVSQLRRSVISFTSNIAEGFGRYSMKEKTQFYFIDSPRFLEKNAKSIIDCKRHGLFGCKRF